jgi:hypothetical protein
MFCHGALFYIDESTEYWFHSPMVLSSPHHYDEYDDAQHDLYHRVAVAVAVVAAVDVARYNDSLVTFAASIMCDGSCIANVTSGEGYS